MNTVGKLNLLPYLKTSLLNPGEGKASEQFLNEVFSLLVIHYYFFHIEIINYRN